MDMEFIFFLLDAKALQLTRYLKYFRCCSLFELVETVFVYLLIHE